MPSTALDQDLPPPAGLGARGLAELATALDEERRTIEELHGALLRQRAGVAASDRDVIEESIRSIGRVVLTLESARRRRLTLTAFVTGGEAVPLSELEAALAQPLPAPLAAARAAVRAAAEAIAADATLNQRILRRALQAGDAFLRHLFSAAAGTPPVYAPDAGAPEGPRDAADRSLLLDRTA